MCKIKSHGSLFTGFFISSPCKKGSHWTPTYLFLPGEYNPLGIKATRSNWEQHIFLASNNKFLFIKHNLFVVPNVSVKKSWLKLPIHKRIGYTNQYFRGSSISEVVLSKTRTFAIVFTVSFYLRPIPMPCDKKSAENDLDSKRDRQ